MATQLTVQEMEKQAAFEEEMVPHLDILYNYALRLTTDPSDAEDLVQESMIKAYRFFHSYERGTNAKGWLYRILRNAFINNYRKKSRRPTEVDYADIAPFYESVRSEQSNTTDMQEQMFQGMMSDEISNALNRLPEDFRTVVMLCDVEGFTYEEIANMLDVPIGTIRSRLHRGRNLLREQIKDYAAKYGYFMD